MKKTIALILCFVMLGSFCGCENNNASDNDEKNFRIVTSFYPVMLIAKAVSFGAENAEVINMTKPQTGCLHDYTLLPEDIKTLEKADVFVINGLGMESFTEKIYESIPDIRVIDLSKGINADKGNAHIWLSPENVQIMAENLKNELVKLDLVNKEIYENRTAQFKKELAELDEEIRGDLKPHENKSVIAFHEAFECFADEYGIKVDAVIEREPGEEPTTGEIKETVKIIKTSGTKILLTEPQYSPATAEIIANETGARIYEIDPIVTGDSYGEYNEYFEKMLNNAKVLKKAFEE